MGFLIAYLLGILTAIEPNKQLGTRQTSQAPATAENPCKCCHHKVPPWKVALEWLTFVAALAAGVATIAYAVITHRMWCEMHQQTATLQNQFEQSQRPWIALKVEIGAGGFTFNANGDGNFNGQIVMKNIGHSPAIGIENIFEVVPVKDQGIFTEPIKRQKEICDSVREANKPLSKTFGVRVLFPDEQSEPLEFSTSIPKGLIDKAAFIAPVQPPYRDFMAVLVGCIDYRVTFSDKHHQTGYIYTIYRRETDHPNIPFALKVGQDLTADRVNLVEYFFGGKYAD
jgi:hypothetical protein